MLPRIHGDPTRHQVQPSQDQGYLGHGLPTNINEVQQLTGRMAALSRFISKSTEKGLPFFKILRKVKDFEWTEKYQRAFEELKAYLVKFPLLVKPIHRDTLYLYISSTSLPSALCWYEKKMVLRHPFTMAIRKWAIELSEYDISYLPRTTITIQALADFVSEMTGTTQEETGVAFGSKRARGASIGASFASKVFVFAYFAVLFCIRLSTGSIPDDFSE
ncbi:hypothetical protein Sango_2806100 [Sesamum angolense]|uniref:Reverse transcriptase/retrotransposon-derived protein RNase H-like domain-containing protein n=1 Tax=Sesamum angolense TaxID=2727404 RepID=A0AAE1T6K3_9LAMI|nr:hypothetical protein Sango_2806100 [Sesamum angolense]